MEFEDLDGTDYQNPDFKLVDQKNTPDFKVLTDGQPPTPASVSSVDRRTNTTGTSSGRTPGTFDQNQYYVQIPERPHTLGGPMSPKRPRGRYAEGPYNMDMRPPQEDEIERQEIGQFANQHIAKAAIRKLARRGGVKRISARIYNEARSYLEEWLLDVLTDCSTYSEHRMRTNQMNPTIRTIDVINALKRRGRNIYGFGQ